MRYGKPTKNKKRIDPRYFLNETIEENIDDDVKVGLGAGGGKMGAGLTVKFEERLKRNSGPPRGILKEDAVGDKISKLRGEGKPQDQAVAIAKSMEERDKLSEDEELGTGETEPKPSEEEPAASAASAEPVKPAAAPATPAAKLAATPAASAEPVKPVKPAAVSATPAAKPAATTQATTQAATFAEPSFDEEEMSKNAREAGLLMDLQQWQKSGGKFKYEPMQSLTYNTIENLRDDYHNKKAELEKKGMTPQQAHRRALKTGTIGGEGSFLTKDLNYGKRWHGLLANPMANVHKGLSKSQKLQLHDLMAKAGAFKNKKSWGYSQMRTEDPVRMGYREWVNSRLGRGEKGSEWNKKQRRRRREEKQKRSQSPAAAVSENNITKSRLLQYIQEEAKKLLKEQDIEHRRNIQTSRHSKVLMSHKDLINKRHKDMMNATNADGSLRYSLGLFKGDTEQRERVLYNAAKEEVDTERATKTLDVMGFPEEESIDQIIKEEIEKILREQDSPGSSIEKILGPKKRRKFFSDDAPETTARTQTAPAQPSGDPGKRLSALDSLEMTPMKSRFAAPAAKKSSAPAKQQAAPTVRQAAPAAPTQQTAKTKRGTLQRAGTMTGDAPEGYVTIRDEKSPGHGSSYVGDKKGQDAYARKMGVDPEKLTPLVRAMLAKKGSERNPYESLGPHLFSAEAQAQRKEVAHAPYTKEAQAQRKKETKQATYQKKADKVYAMFDKFKNVAQSGPDSFHVTTKSGKTLKMNYKQMQAYDEKENTRAQAATPTAARTATPMSQSTKKGGTHRLQEVPE